MSLIYLFLKATGFAVDFGYDKIVFLILVDLDVIAFTHLASFLRRRRRGW